MILKSLRFHCVHRFHALHSDSKLASTLDAHNLLLEPYLEAYYTKYSYNHHGPCFGIVSTCVTEYLAGYGLQLPVFGPGSRNFHTDGYKNQRLLYLHTTVALRTMGFIYHDKNLKGRLYSCMKRDTMPSNFMMMDVSNSYTIRSVNKAAHWQGSKLY